MKKSTLEEAFRKAGLQPAARRTIQGRDVLLADGWCATPHIAFRRFGIDEGDFKDGCFVSAWLWAHDDENVALGRPLFFEPLHDIETLPLAQRRTARINAAARDADDALKRLKRHEGHALAAGR